MVLGVEEDARQRVVVARRNRIVLVVVAARARDRQPEQSAADDIHAVVAFVGVRDLDRAVVVVPRTEAEKPERGQCPHAVALVGEIGRELGANERVVRHVVVERFHDPVAIEVRVGIRIQAAALRIEAAVVVLAVARDVEPHASPRLAVLRRREQPIDHFRECLGRSILEKGVDLLGRRRQAGEIESRAANEREPVGGRHRSHAVVFEAREHETIDVVSWPRRVVHDRQGRRAQRLEGPERALLGGDDVPLRSDGRWRRARRRGPRCATADPLDEDVDVLGLQFGPAVRHLRRAGDLLDRLNQQAVVRLARDDRGTRLSAREHVLARVEPEAALLVRGVTVETIRRENRANPGFKELGRLRRRGRSRRLTRSDRRRQNDDEPECRDGGWTSRRSEPTHAGRHRTRYYDGRCGSTATC